MEYGQIPKAEHINPPKFPAQLQVCYKRVIHGLISLGSNRINVYRYWQAGKEHVRNLNRFVYFTEVRTLAHATLFFHPSEFFCYQFCGFYPLSYLPTRYVTYTTLSLALLLSHAFTHLRPYRLRLTIYERYKRYRYLTCTSSTDICFAFTVHFVQKPKLSPKNFCNL